MILTIDGPSGTGKTTIAQRVAEALFLPYYDTGAMYRAVAWALLHQGVSLSDEKALQALLDRLSFTIKSLEGKKHYFVGSIDVTEEIRTKKINAIVSEVAANARVREAMWKQQRAFAKEHGAVFEGRDMGSVVFPDADLKIFLTARAEVRAKRRLTELQRTLPEEAKGLDEEAMIRQLNARDEIDAGRELAPLKKPEGAIEIDTSDLNIAQVTQEILSAYQSMWKKRCKSLEPGWLKSRRMPPLYRFILCLVWLGFKFFYRLKIYGLEHFTPQPALIAPNHTSFFDPPIIGISWPQEVYYLARESLFRGLFGKLIFAINARPVRGDAADIAAFKTVLGLLAEGKKVVIFPEGQRTDGEISPMRPGIGLLLSRSKTAIIPAYIEGAGQVWGRARRLPKPWGKIRCVFGSPLLWSSFAHLGKKEAETAIMQRLEESLRALKQWLERGAKGIPP